MARRSSPAAQSTLLRKSAILAAHKEEEMNAPTKTVAEAGVLHGLKIVDAIKKAGIQYVLSVPDLHTSKGLLFPIAQDPDLKLIRVCKEDETIGISAGLSYGPKRALVLIQYTGFLYAMNAIRGVSVEYKQPTCLMIGMLGLEPGVQPQQSGKYGLRIIEPILDVMGIPHHLIESDEDLSKIGPAIDECYNKSFPVAFLIGRRPV
jgi:sulfopyruvate decarboxylase subunit alpha